MVTFNFLGVGGGAQRNNKKSKNEKTKNEKKQQLGMKMAWLCLPSPRPPWPAPLAWVPPLCPLSRPPEGPGPGAPAGSSGRAAGLVGCWLVQLRPQRPRSGAQLCPHLGGRHSGLGGFGSERGDSSFCSGDCLDGPGMLGVVVSVSSSTYKVTEESRRRRLGQCWWIWNQA